MQGAVCCYTKALKLSDSQTERAVLHRNRSACYLKLEDYSKAEADSSKGGITTNSAKYKKYPHTESELNLSIQTLSLLNAELCHMDCITIHSKSSKQASLSKNKIRYNESNRPWGGYFD